MGKPCFYRRIGDDASPLLGRGVWVCLHERPKTCPLIRNMVSGSFGGARKRRTQRKQRKLRKQRTARKQRRQLKKQSGGCLCDEKNPYAVQYADCPVCSQKQIIYFYEADEQPHGFLSNFYLNTTDHSYIQTRSAEDFDDTFGNYEVIPIIYEGITFMTSEQAFCYAKVKALGYGDDVLEVIINTPNPHTIKDYGSGDKNVVTANGEVKIGATVDWKTVKWGPDETGPIMRAILESKFSNPYLARKLKSTGHAILAEAAPGDFNWGIGFSELDAPHNMHKWGKNRLGLTLMKIRDTLPDILNGANNARGNNDYNDSGY